MLGSLSPAAAARFFPTSHLPQIPPDGDAVRRVLAEELVSVKSRIEHTPSAGDFSVYTGSAGVAYMYWLLASTEEGKVPLKRADLVERARAHINVALRVGRQSRQSSSRVSTLMTGLVGVYSVAAAIHTAANEPSQAAAMCKEVLSLAPTATQQGVPSELLYGRVGFLSALLFLAANAGLQLSDCTEVISTVVQRILADGAALGGGSDGWPLMWEWHDKEYLGAAHGVVGICTVLLHLREVVGQFKGGEELLRGTVDRMLEQRFPSGNLPSSIGSDKDVLVHWCHGAPGLVSLMCAAHDAYKDPKYLDAARKAADVVSKRGLLKKGFGICHGISGSALSLFCMHRADRAGGYDKAALRMALFACSPAGLDPDQAQALKDTLVAQPDSPESLMEGQAGLGCLLGILLQGPDSPNLYRMAGAAAPWIM